jgi:hypothetical protein
VLPRAVADSIDRWQLGSLTLDAIWQGASAPLRLELRDAAGKLWNAGRIPPPPRWLLRLDAPPLDSVARRALARAFDESALYSEDARTASRTPRSSTGARAGLRAVARHRPRGGAHGGEHGPGAASSGGRAPGRRTINAEPRRSRHQPRT